MYAKEIGGVCWIDLTTGKADDLRDFYSSVVGFEVEPLPMGEYDDYVMKSPEDEGGAVGVCHARGTNAQIPPQWMVYFNVKNLTASVADCEKRGGKVVCPPRELGDSHMCVIEDPAGAVCALVGPQ